MIYLDNNATTMVPDEIIEAMKPYYRDFYGNPHSAHALGRRAHDGLERARAGVAPLIGADASNLRFVSCGTEGNAIVIRGLRPQAGRRTVVASSVEHPSVLSLLRRMDERGEIELRVVGVDSDARIDLDAMAAAVDDSTMLVCAMLAQNEIGTIQPIARIAELAHAHKALLLVDAVQAAGKIAIDVHALGADFLTISGHKLHAPKGIGALYLRAGLELDPLWSGGGQEFGLRSGTEPVASAVALSAAAQLALQHLPEMARVRELRDEFEQVVTRGCEFATVNGQAAARLPNTSSISFDGMYSDEVVAVLDAEQICASGGAACESGKREPTAVMKALGLPESRALGAVRFSLSRFTTSEEMERAGRFVVSLINSMQSGRQVAGASAWPS